MNGSDMLLTVILSFFHFLSFNTEPTSTIQIHNATNSGDLIAVYGILPGEQQISQNFLLSPLPEDSTTLVSIPRMLYPGIIGVTSSGLSYREISFAAVDSAIIEFDRMRREYGKIFTKVHGSHRLTIENLSPVQIVSIMVSDSTEFPGEVLYPDVLFSSEAAYIWLNPGSYDVSIRDYSNTLLNYTINIDSVSSTSISLTADDFIQESSVEYAIGNGSFLSELVSAVAIDSLNALDLYNSNGEMIASYDLPQMLSCWDILTVYTEEPVSWLSAYDSNDRSYSLDLPDSILGVYIIDLNCVDFDISFDNNNDCR